MAARFSGHGVHPRPQHALPSVTLRQTSLAAPAPVATQVPCRDRFRHYRTYRDKYALEFGGITDNSMQRYVARLREAVIQYD